MKIYHGNIITVNQNDEVMEYLVEDQGIIQYVGNELPAIYQNGEMIELGKQALIPAFVDSHQHFASFSTFYAGLDVSSATSNIEVLEMIKEFVEKSKQKTLIAFGLSIYAVEERKMITRSELDLVCPDQEIMVVKYDGHACVINSKLLKKLEKKLKDVRGYHLESGEMNQEAFFICSNYITNSISIPQLISNMHDAIDTYAKKGIGCIHTVSGVGFLLNLDITLEKLFAKGLKNDFQIRVFPQSLDVSVATSRKLPRIGGCFECALDGCFGSHDASMNEDYCDSIGGNGVLYYSDEKVIEFCKKANRKHLQIELHAIGDKAFDQACRAIKAALDDYPREDHRHGIIHDCLPTKEGIEICKKYHIQLPMQSAFIKWRQEPDEYLEMILGKQRANRLNPIHTLLKNDLMISLGSDAPCTFPDPILWMHNAVNHSNSNERITIKQALRMCTYNGYYATFDEKERGSLEVGKKADMVILSQNPYEIDPESIDCLKVHQLLLKGKVYTSCKENILSTVGRALISKHKY